MEQSDINILADKWTAAFHDELVFRIETDPEFSYWKWRDSAPEAWLARARAFSNGALKSVISNDLATGGRAFKAACKAIGIKPTRKAMMETFANRRKAE